MRTTIDLPDELFREAKTRSVQQGTTLKNLITDYIRSGLGKYPFETDSSKTRRPAPPVAIRRISGQVPAPARTNRQLNALLEEEEIRASHMQNQDSKGLEGNKCGNMTPEFCSLARRDDGADRDL